MKKKNRQQTAAKPERPVERNDTGAIADTEHDGFQDGYQTTGGAYRSGEKERVQQPSGENSFDTNTGSERSERSGDEKRKHRAECNRGARENWNENWFEVAAEFCQLDDGLPAELDGFKMSKAGHRVARLKALGNAIVPQVVMEIMREIKQLTLNFEGGVI